MFESLSLHHIKIIKTLLVTYYIIMFFMFALNNTIDFNANFEYVQHVFKMDTTFNPHDFRAIHKPRIHLLAYLIIIGWQYLTCFVGALGLRKYVKNGQKYLINTSIFMGISVYFFGYLIIASEWFLMWQSNSWNGQRTAFQFTILFMLIFIFFNGNYQSRD